MKRRTIALCAAAALLALPAFAQEDMPSGAPAPPEELGKLSKMIGYWQGSGTSRDNPSQAGAEWTSTSHVRKVLDGHFLREDMRIESESWKTPLQFISFYGYDQQEKRFFTLGVCNTGRADLTEFSLDDDGTMVSGSVRICQGKRVVERWITKLSDDKISYLGNMAIGDGNWFVHVKGTAKKVSGDPKSKIVDVSYAFMSKAGDEMGKLKGLVGKHKFDGEMCAIPGSPMIPISGESITEPIFGGTVLQTVVRYDPVDGHTCQGWWAIAWDPNEQKYSSIGVNNTGSAGIAKGVWINANELVLTCSQPWFDGKPSVTSCVTKCADDGTVKSYTCYSIIGSEKPFRSFHVDYSKQ